jgi:hypothetical protein
MLYDKDVAPLAHLDDISEISTLPIAKDLDNWIKGMSNLSTLPKENHKPLVTTHFLNGKIIVDIAVAQKLFSDQQVRFNSPKRLLRQVVDRLCESETEVIKNRLIANLIAGDTIVLEQILRALKDLQSRDVPLTSEKPWSESVDSKEQEDGLETPNFEGDHIEDHPLHHPSNMTKRSFDEDLKKLEHELLDTRVVLENYKEKHLNLDTNNIDLLEINAVLSDKVSKLESVLSKEVIIINAKLDEIRSNSEKERYELIMSHRSDIELFSERAVNERNCFQNEIKSLELSLSQKQQRIDEVLLVKQKLSALNKKISDENLKLQSEIHVLKCKTEKLGMKACHAELKQKSNMERLIADNKDLQDMLDDLLTEAKDEKTFPMMKGPSWQRSLSLQDEIEESIPN